MNTQEVKEREWEIHKQLEEIRQRQQECDELQKELERLEEEKLWQNKQVKDLNDDLMESYPKDARLQNLLFEKEEMLQQRMSFEKSFFEDCRDMLKEQRKKNETMREACEAELLIIHKEKGAEKK